MEYLVHPSTGELWTTFHLVVWLLVPTLDLECRFGALAHPGLLCGACWLQIGASRAPTCSRYCKIATCRSRATRRTLLLNRCGPGARRTAREASSTSPRGEGTSDFRGTTRRTS